MSSTGRVLVFTGHFFPHVGGVERFSRELWSRMVKRGWHVTLVTSNTDGAPERETLWGIDVVRLPVFKIFHGRLPIFTLSAGLLSLARTIGPRPDVIVTNTRFFPSSVLGAALAKLWGVPNFHIDYGSEHVDLGSPVATKLGEWYDHALGGWVLRNAATCVGVSQSVSDFVAHLGRPGAGVLPNAIDTAAYAVDQAGDRAKFGIGVDKPALLYVGRLIKDKGIMVLCEAYQRLPEEERPYLLIAGDGHMRAEVDAFASKHSRVRFLGRVEPDSIRDLLACADVFVNPSLYPEGLPLAILEAGAAGLPVIATPMGGTPEIIIDEHHGIMVPAGDVQALANAVRALLSDETRRVRLGNTLKKRVREHFDCERITDVAEAELRRLAKISAGTGVRQVANQSAR